MKNKATVDVSENSDSEPTSKSPKKSPSKASSSKTNKSSPIKSTSGSEKELRIVTDSDIDSEKEVETESTTQATFTAEELTPDDEIYLMQCPIKFSKKDLCKKTINFSNQKQTIITEAGVYQVELLSTDKKFVTLALPKKTSGGSLVKLPLRGQVIIQKYVSLPEVITQDEDSLDADKVVFPTEIKVRHPLLGVDWESHINLVNEALKNDQSNKKKAKKIKKELLEEETNRSIKREASSSERSTPKKKKIR